MAYFMGVVSEIDEMNRCEKSPASVVSNCSRSYLVLAGAATWSPHGDSLGHAQRDYRVRRPPPPGPSTDYRLDSAWFGNGAQMKQRALDNALLLVA